MSHISYTLRRSGRYYYNRRVPKHAVQAYGSFIRLALSKDAVILKRFTKLMLKSLQILILVGAASQAVAHSGGLNKQGCHAGSQPYHCHRTEAVAPSASNDPTVLSPTSEMEILSK